MRFEYSEGRDRVRADGKTTVQRPGMAAAIATVAKNQGLEIEFLGWDRPLTHAVKLSEAHKPLLMAEMAAQNRRGNDAMRAAMKSECCKCGRHGTFTTGRTVCDDCAAE